MRLVALLAPSLFLLATCGNWEDTEPAGGGFAGCIPALEAAANGAAQCCTGATFSTTNSCDASGGNCTADALGTPAACCTPTGAVARNSNSSDCCGQSGADANGSCCPSSLSGNAPGCTPTCTSDADCNRFAQYNQDNRRANEGSHAIACAPQNRDGGPVAGPYVCTDEDAKPYHGCKAGSNACSAGYDCWADRTDDSNLSGFQLCALSCDADSDCGAGACCAPGICENAGAGCAGVGLCLPCGTFSVSPSGVLPAGPGGR